MKSEMKTIGATAAFAAIALSIPTAVNALADDQNPAPTPAPTPASAPAASITTVPAPVARIPDPQGPGCDAYGKAVPTGVGSFAGMATQNGSQAIASNPDLSDFSAAISGQWNPAVNLVGVLDNGPYNVFAPTNAAFAALDPEALSALKADPAELTSVLYYHMVLGILGPDDVHGKLTTQQGKQITVVGKGGDIKIDDIAKVVCGGISAQNAKLYMIDTVLTPANALAADATTSTSPTSPTSPTEVPTSTTSTPGAPTSTSEAPATSTSQAPTVTETTPTSPKPATTTATA
jgi:uncharacterized surface protein with fasciclin (FAS1) repeats